MFQTLSKRIANYLARQLKNNEDVEIYAYALEIIFGSGAKVFLILSLGLMLNVFDSMVFCLIPYIFFRSFGGGVHLSTYLRCLMVGTIILVFLALISKGIPSTKIAVLLFISTLVLGFYTIIKWAPAYTEKKKGIGEKVRLKQKKKTMVVLAGWFGLTFYLIIQGYIDLAVAATLGALISIILMTPWGFALFRNFDGFINKIRKEVLLKDVEKNETSPFN